jgi:kelch-like protein 2/3
MLVIGGQAPKAIRSVECFDFKEDRWFQLAEMPSRRCRCGIYNFYSSPLLFKHTDLH